MTFCSFGGCFGKIVVKAGLISLASAVGTLLEPYGSRRFWTRVKLLAMPSHVIPDGQRRMFTFTGVSLHVVIEFLSAASAFQQDSQGRSIFRSATVRASYSVLLRARTEAFSDGTGRFHGTAQRAAAVLSGIWTIPSKEQEPKSQETLFDGKLAMICCWISSYDLRAQLFATDRSLNSDNLAEASTAKLNCILLQANPGYGSQAGM